MNASIGLMFAENLSYKNDIWAILSRNYGVINYSKKELPNTFLGRPELGIELT